MVPWLLVGVSDPVVEFSCAAWVNASRVKETFVEIDPLSGVIAPPLGRLQAARIIMSNKEIDSRKEFGLICANPPLFAFCSTNTFMVDFHFYCVNNYRTPLNENQSHFPLTY
jgi:hypothetical protein